MSCDNSVFIRTLKGERCERTPIWLMRQAGRYLPEYRELRAENSMLQMVRTPELAAEVTLQPLRRFPLDAAIIFADILTPLIGMGADLDFKAGEGPVISNPVRSASDVAALKVPPPGENVGYTLSAIQIVTAELDARGIPLIGFSGAPFTLSAYLIEGGSPGDLHRIKKLMYSEPEVWHALQRKLVPLVADYLIAQAHAGCSALQLFDSWLGYVAPLDYDEFVEPYLMEILTTVQAAVSVPIVFFGTGTGGLLSRFRRLPVQVIGVDWRVGLSEAQELLGRPATLQGNLDPLMLLGPPERMEHRAMEILQEAKVLKSHVFNLGHGVLQHTPPEHVERLVNLVRSYKG